MAKHLATNIWNRLTEPAASLTEPERRRSARFLISLLVVLIPVSCFLAATPIFAAPTRPLWQNVDLMIMIALLIMLIVIYRLSRGHNYEQAVVLAVAVGLLAILLPTIVAHDTSLSSAYYLLVLVIFGSMFLSSKATFGIVVASLAGIFVLTVFVRGVTLVGLLDGPVAFLLIGSGLILMGARHRDQLERDRRAALTASEERLRQLIESSEDIILMQDLSGKYTYYNASLQYGLRAADLLGKTPYDVHERAVADQIVNRVKQVAATGKGITAESQVNWQGKELWFSDYSYPVKDQNERVLSVATISRNITERKRAEETLKNSEEEYRRLFENNPHPMWAYDMETLAFVAVNDAAVHHYGYSRSEFLAMTIKEIRPTEDVPALLDDVAKTYKSLNEAGIWRHRKKDGSIRFVEITSHATTFAGRSARLVLANDVTERKRTEEQIDIQLHRLSALRDIDQAITASLDLNVTLNLLLAQVTTQLGVDAADILLLDKQGRTLEYTAGRGFRSSAITRARFAIGEGRAGRAALERRVLRADSLADGADARVTLPFIAGEGFVVQYAAPLVAKGQIKGVLEIFHRTPLSPDSDWLRFMDTLATQAAIAVADAEMFSDLQRSNTELMLAYDTTLEGWSRALDLRDRETEGHTQRVTETTVRLASALGMNDKELVHIRRGALLHDIGKMGIPDSILLKPDSLTEREWEIMRKHPVYAYDLLAPIAYLRPALDISHYHHEKWDGSGYPVGLKGEQIPLAARIFAVVDVWDALRSDRPYRAAWSAERAIEHIRSSAGTHFDPRVVAAFLLLLDDEKLLTPR